PIVDRTAVAFAREFYGAWAAGEPIDSALAYARRLFSANGAGAAADWGIPVLYMGPVEGLRLELEQPRPRWPWPFLAVRWLVTGAIALLTLLSLLLLDLPGVVQAARTQVPIIRCRYPYPMHAGFNVAVAEFGRLEPDSPPKRYDLAVQHTNELKSQLTHELNALLQELGGESVAFQVESYCMIGGATEREQTEAAAWLAGATHADLVVYGYLVGPGEGSGVQIRFYSNKPDWTWSELFDGTWLAASERLNCTDGCLSLALGNRVKALSRLTAAMTYFFAAVPCREYLNPIAACRANLDQALRVLNEEDITNDDDRVLSRWSGRGKEVVHLFRGGIYLERAIRHSLDPRLASGDREQMLAAWEPALANFEAARAEFEQATQINPLYSRAYIGLALTDYSQGYLGPRANFQLIERAIAQYDQLLAPPEGQTAPFEKPEGAFVDLKLYYNRAIAHYSKFFLLGDEAAAQQAQADLEAVTREFVALAAAQDAENAGLLCAWTGRFCAAPPDLPRAVRELAARSYYFLGALHQHAGRTPVAIDAYTQSIALTSDPETAAVARYALGRLYEETGEPAQAQAVYVQLCQAIRTWDGIQGWQEPAIARLVALGASEAKEECT
ncbi:MAG TPA: tetratricopeptide repeat protein, partial [Caldilineaceae bacterium]|nr:tetratricopeptide repeat protein [Caldilineaceae bacterium]